MSPKAALLGLAALFGAGSVHAQTPAEEAQETRILYESKPEHDIFKFDYGAPSSPAMTLLGLSPDKTPPSTSLTDFVVSLPSLYGEGGQSIALDFSIMRLWEGPERADYHRYVEKDARALRLAYRTRFGVAALNGEDGDGDPKKAVQSRVSVGFSTSVLDGSDPLVTQGGYFSRCLTKVHEISQPLIDAAVQSSPEKMILTDAIDDIDGRVDVLGALPQPLTPAQQAELAALQVKRERLVTSLDALNAASAKSTQNELVKLGVPDEVEKCIEGASRRARFSPDLDIGLGVVGQGEPGRLEDIEWRGSALWVAFKAPFRVSWDDPDLTDEEKRNFGLPVSAWMVVGSARAGWDESLATGDTVTPFFRADTLDAWIGIERLAPTHRFSVQYGWLEVDARQAIGRPFEKSGERYLVSGQIQLGSRSPLWLGISYGNGYGTVAALDSNTALVTLSYSPGQTSIAGKD